MLESLKKMYARYGQDCLPFIEMLLMSDTTRLDKNYYHLSEYKDMGWLTYTLNDDGTCSVILTDPERLYPPKNKFSDSMEKTKKVRRKSLTEAEKLLKYMVSSFDTPVDLYIQGTSAYAPKYQKLAKTILAEYGQAVYHILDWANDNWTHLPQKPEFYQLLTKVWVEQLFRWQDNGIPHKKTDTPNFANREVD